MDGEILKERSLGLVEAEREQTINMVDVTSERYKVKSQALRDRLEQREDGYE